jgi:hypothetical protein
MYCVIRETSILIDIAIDGFAISITLKTMLREVRGGLEDAPLREFCTNIFTRHYTRITSATSKLKWSNCNHLSKWRQLYREILQKR